MSYLVLARKYRPKTFTEMVGQEHVVQALTNALTSQRLHHAYLFTGTRGVGKTTVSRILAKSLNCAGVDGLGGITASPCGVCEACVAIDAGRFVDYTELDAASNRGVEDMTTLLEQAVYKPVQGRFKVFMIDEVHMLSGHAFNAMLKTLEEPPEYLKFVLATTDPQKVPVTVLSRCLQFNLRPMAPETVLAHLAFILGFEGVAFEDQALRLLSKNAHGSMRDALSLTDQAIAFGDGSLKEEQVRSMLGAVDDRYVFDLIAHLSNGDGSAVIAIVRQMQTMGLSATSTLEQMMDVLHRMLVNHYSGLSTADDVTMSADEIQLLYSICLHGKSDLGLASDEYAALTMVLLRLLAFKPRNSSPQGGAVEPGKKPVPIDSNYVGAHASIAVPLVIQPQPIEGSKTEVLAPRRSELQAATSVVAATMLGDVWFECVQTLIKNEAISALVRELALQSQLILQEEMKWTLQIDNALLANSAHAEKLQTALQTIKKNVQLSVQSGLVQDTPAMRLAQAARELQVKAERLILNDQAVQQLMREFDGKIVQGSIKPINLATI